MPMTTIQPVLLLLPVLAHHAATTTAQTVAGTNRNNLRDTTSAPSTRGVYSSSSSVQTTVLFLCILLLIVAGLSCCIYSICGRRTFKLSETNGITGETTNRRGRTVRYFREDLLRGDEIRRLWTCWYCDFANYELKTNCALCGHEKKDKQSSDASQCPSSPRTGTHTLASYASTMLSPSTCSPTSYANLMPSAVQQSENELSAPSPLFHSPLSINTSKFAYSQPPPSPCFGRKTPVCTPRSQRRKEWQTALNDNNEVVWMRHPSFGSSQDPMSPRGPMPETPKAGSESLASPASSTSSAHAFFSTPLDDLASATAFVTRNQVSQANPHGLLTVFPADKAHVYPTVAPMSLADRLSMEMARPSSTVHESKISNDETIDRGMDPFAIESLRSLTFPAKHRWFMQETSAMLNVRWKNPTISNDLVLKAERDNLLKSAVMGLIQVSPQQLRRPLRVQFVNEPGIDAGGIVREWLALVVAEFLDDANGLFQQFHSIEDGLSYIINPNAALVVQDHLLYFRAFGRLMGKALLEGHLIPAQLSDVLFKNILGVPLSFADLVAQDGELARSVQDLWETTLIQSEGDDDDAYGLDFSVYHAARGVVDLKPDGRNIIVREDNKRDYIALFVQWHLAMSAAEEAGAIVSGLHDVLSPQLLAPFDYQELSLLLCGSPVIDVNDWEEHTAVRSRKNKPSRVVTWFWKTVRAMSTDNQERLLQFTTGSRRVPVQGFKALTSSDGRLCAFTLNFLPKDECAFPRAYTCFNRLDLPVYRNEKELREALELVVKMDVTGFTIQ